VWAKGASLAHERLRRLVSCVVETAVLGKPNLGVVELAQKDGRADKQVSAKHEAHRILLHPLRLVRSHQLRCAADRKSLRARLLLVAELDRLVRARAKVRRVRRVHELRHLRVPAVHKHVHAAIGPNDMLEMGGGARGYGTSILTR